VLGKAKMAEASPNPTVFVTCIDDSILGRKRTQLNFWGRKDQNLMLQIEENLESIRHHRDQDPGTAQPAPVQLLNQPRHSSTSPGPAAQPAPPPGPAQPADVFYESEMPDQPQILEKEPEKAVSRIPVRYSIN
jgi:hypothetical protein